MANPFKIIDGLLEVEETIGDFIANGPDGGIAGHIRDGYRHRCRELANLPTWARLLGGVSLASATRICTPYWDANDWDGPIANPPPFTGGQCYGANYSLDFTFTNQQGARQTLAQQSTGRLVGTYTTLLEAPDFYTFGFERQAVPDGPISRVTIGTVFGRGNPSPVITNVVRLDGVDDCGDLPAGEPIPGPNPPPDPGPLPGPEPTPDPRNPTGPPLFPIPPYEDPVFGPIPIEEPEGEPGGGGPPSGGDGLPGDPEAVGPDAGGAEGGEPGEDVDFGEPPEGRVWVGAVIQASVDTRYGNIPGTGPGNTVYPTTVGNASLIYEGYRGTSVRILSRFTDLYRQVSAVVLTGCRVSALPGVDLTVKPISAVTCPENPCEEE